MNTITLCLAVVLVQFLSYTTAAVSCLDEDGNPTDWWVILKTPEGYKYDVFDADSGEFTESQYTLQDASNGCLSHTLNQLYNADPNSIGHVFFDDQSPDNVEHWDNAHMKGDLGFDSNGGFWLVHSVPRFPNYTQFDYFYPEEETKFGQSYMCLNLDLTTINTVASFMMIDWPFVYDSNFPSALSNQLPNVQQLINGAHMNASTAQSNPFSTSNGKSFVQFAKNSQWNSDLYEGLVEPYIGLGMKVETWQNGENPLPSYCTPQYKYDSINIKSIKISSSVHWKETMDHSKWGVSIPNDKDDDSQKWACVGDINRMQSQRGRGGGTVCTQDVGLWDAFNSIIASSDDC